MSDPDEITNIRLHPQVTRPVSLQIPVNTLDLVGRVAASRDMSPEALLKFYIGQGLRQDAARLYSERILETTAEVLARHISSEEERFAIMSEIQGEAAA